VAGLADTPDEDRAEIDGRGIRPAQRLIVVAVREHLGQRRHRVDGAADQRAGVPVMHPPDTALSLASVVAGTAAQAKARRLGIVEEREKTSREARERAAAEQTVRLLGKDIELVAGADGLLLAAGSDGKPTPAAPVKNYITRAFGNRLQEARAAMQELAASLPLDGLNLILAIVKPTPRGA
jgi:hypothetical protein